jgi:hypothetical protein
MKGKQKKSAAIPHSVNAEAKVFAGRGISWAHENEVLAVCAPVTFAGKRMRVLVESLAGACARSIAKNRNETAPLSWPTIEFGGCPRSTVTRA